MQDFWLYFQLGRDHIADWRGYDHILFVTALCLRYLLKDWKKVLVLVTAFTIGHSITLALSVLNYVNISTHWVEFLIPVTIVVTALSNIWQKDFEFKSRFPLIYFFALFFGLIHGLGFSSYLKSLLGKETNIASELLAFNLGLEFGQILIVLAVLAFSWVCISLLKFSRRQYLLFLSGAIFGIAFLMAIQRFPL
ncbi:MAG: HupE / UreJ protein [Bacteroidetes bacterium 13_1_20CM_4_60_6]|nr:MAG: HupE / UreJ protein [Bacteroidetes bacterium 13_1_20CM_4_60_6]